MEGGLDHAHFDKFCRAWLGGLVSSGVLAIGADEAIIREYAGPKTAEDFVTNVVTFLTSGDKARLAYLSPTRPIPDASNTHPFKLAYNFIEPIAAANLAGLEERFALTVGTLTDARPGEPGGVPSPGKMAGRMVGLMFTDRRSHGLLADDVRPGPSSAESRVAKILNVFKAQGYLDPSMDIAGLSAERDWRTLGHRPEDEIARTIAGRLASAGYRSLLAPGAEPPSIAMSDPFYNSRAAGREDSSVRDELIGSGKYDF